MGLLSELPPPPPGRSGWPWDSEFPAEGYENTEAWPKLSIVTPTFNQADYIEETIRSILLQNYPNLEYIIIDGKSTDETPEIIKKYDRWITFWISEKDSGQSEAINKGMDRVTGDVVNWINSDDYLEPNALFNIARAFQEQPEVHMAASKSRKFGEGIEDQIVPRDQSHVSDEDFLFNFWYMQPSCFWKTSVFKSLFPLNEELHYCMDTDLFVRYFLTHGRDHLSSIDHVTVNFRMHESGKSISSQLGFNEERLKIDQSLLAAGLRGKKSSSDQNPELLDYTCSVELDAQGLQQSFDKKWSEWQSDPSKKYLTVAEYAGWYHQYSQMRHYSWQAILANPLKPINWRYFIRAVRKSFS